MSGEAVCPQTRLVDLLSFYPNPVHFWVIAVVTGARSEADSANPETERGLCGDATSNAEPTKISEFKVSQQRTAEEAP